MISVIVPVYNVEKYLRKCLDSIINQTYKDLEIILIDDGSTDSSGQICDEYAKDNQRIIVIHQHNGGQAAARNKGLDYVLNRSIVQINHYITFMDSDDTIDSLMYETMVNIIELEKYDIAICGHRIVTENDKPTSCQVGVTRPLSEQELWKEIFGRLNNAVWNKLYRAELIKDLRFLEGMIHGEDLIFNIQYLTRCKKGVINESLFYNYLKRAGSITTQVFNDKKLMEIVSKDAAKVLIAEYCPAQMESAELYCFRARMNVIRSVYKAGLQGLYKDVLDNCKAYVINNYKLVRRKMNHKELMEYFLFRFGFPLYKLLSKLF